MGCPMPKIVNNGDGSALMRDPERAARIVEAGREGRFRAGDGEDAQGLG